MTIKAFCSVMLLYNFNPHSREGSDEYKKDILYSRGISIHTPARGVTHQFLQPGRVVLISIHTPARGVTLTLPVSGQYSWDISIHTPARGVTVPNIVYYFICPYFNPHSREGSDFK